MRRQSKHDESSVIGYWMNHPVLFIITMLVGFAVWLFVTLAGG